MPNKFVASTGGKHYWGALLNHVKTQAFSNFLGCFSNLDASSGLNWASMIYEIVNRMIFSPATVRSIYVLMLVLREINDYEKSLMPFFLAHIYTTKLQFIFLFRAPKRRKEERSLYKRLLIVTWIVIIIRFVNGFGNEY